ncbi:uncharacterized protein LOC102807996 [Saccoglossus kowalevskii]|uniref:Nitrogen regulatory protein NUT1-like n=1 Tax=Saccoglossus kowalevskii TaxID=10224 RepID=A0ABM0M0K8_SACKO|nr:PREDICTED: nitrogen regulatory protein NUT1-like [Saccoglossus kowalevskii]
MKIIEVPCRKMNRNDSKIFSGLTLADLQQYRNFFPGPDQFYEKNEGGCNTGHNDDCNVNNGNPSETGLKSLGKLDESGGDVTSDTHSENNVSDCGDMERPRSNRKVLRPSKSAMRNDPSFRGVTFKLKANLKRKARGPESQLVIDSFFSVRKRQRRQNENSLSIGRMRRSSSNIVDSGSSCSGSEHETKVAYTYHQTHRPTTGKQCASCSTRSTPLWRDAEDGTPLCNACGIRYKKYRVRCSYCWHIPKKDGKSYPNCARCGDCLRLSVIPRDREQSPISYQ